MRQAYDYWQDQPGSPRREPAHERKRIKRPLPHPDHARHETNTTRPTRGANARSHRPRRHKISPEVRPQVPTVQKRSEPQKSHPRTADRLESLRGYPRRACRAPVTRRNYCSRLTGGASSDHSSTMSSPMLVRRGAARLPRARSVVMTNARYGYTAHATERTAERPSATAAMIHPGRSQNRIAYRCPRAARVHKGPRAEMVPNGKPLRPHPNKRKRTTMEINANSCQTLSPRSTP